MILFFTQYSVYPVRPNSESNYGRGPIRSTQFNSAVNSNTIRSELRCSKQVISLVYANYTDLLKFECTITGESVVLYLCPHVSSRSNTFDVEDFT